MRLTHSLLLDEDENIIAVLKWKGEVELVEKIKKAYRSEYKEVEVEEIRSDLESYSGTVMADGMRERFSVKKIKLI